MYLSGPEQDPFASLTKELEQQTSAAGYFDKPLAGEALKRDNENFAYALFDIMPLEEKINWYVTLGVPPSPDPRYMQLLGSMLYALPANYMNISLRLEMTRVALAEELAEQTGAGSKLGAAHLGSQLTEFFKKTSKTWGRFVDSLSDFFQEVGKSIGEGLQSIGRNVLSFRQALIALGGPAMKYVTDFLILTPGVKFLFGDLSNELGTAIVEDRRVSLTPIAVGYAEYLTDMSLALGVASPFLPPPFNLVAKVISIVYKVGAGLIAWQVQMHYKDLLAHAEEANAKVRVDMEHELRAHFRGLEAEMEAAGLEVKSDNGANTMTQPTGGGLSKTGLLVLGGIGALAVLVIFGVK